MTGSGSRPAAGRETIGVDLGGTKMLLGVVDAAASTVHRRVAASAGLTGDEVLQLLETELEIALETHPGVGAVGLGVPCTIDRARGVCVSAVNLPLIDVAVRDRISEHVGLPVSIDNDGNVAAIAENRIGAARGARDVVMLTIGTGIGGGLILGGRPYRGAHGAGAELGHVVVDIDGPPCQGNCPNHGCIESIASGTALRAEAERAAAAAPDSGLAKAGANGATIDGELVTELARSGEPTSIAVLETIGRRLGVALSGLANIFDPGGDRRRRRRDGRRRAAARARPGGVPGPGAAAAERDPGPGRRPRARRRDGRGGDPRRRRARRGRGGRLMAGRLIVCPTPIGNIGDVSPRVRQALADADLVACEDTRRAGRLYERLDLDPPRFVSNHDSNEEGRAPQLAKAIERGARVALLSDAGTPVLSDPGYRLIRACIDRGIEIEVLPGPTAITTALVASGPAGRPLALRGLPAAPCRRARAGPAVDRDRRRVRVSAPAARLAAGAGGAGARIARPRSAES